MSYEPHERLVAPARDTSSLIRLILGLITITILYAVLLGLGSYALKLSMGNAWVGELAAPGGALTPGQTLAILRSFSFLIIAIGLVIILVHRRNPITLFGGLAVTTLQFLSAMRGLATYLALTTIFIFLTEDFRQQLSLVFWLTLLPVSIIFILIQVTAEELVFRGYIQSQLAALGAPRAIWILIPSILFGVLHYNPSTMNDIAPWTALWAVGFGILAADLTARNGTLGPAIAFHFANNFMALAILGLEDFLGGLSLFVYPFSVTDTTELATRLPNEAIGILVAYLFVRLAMRT